MMKKIDKRKSYKLMVDVETTLADNHQQVVFDLGVAVFTKDGKIYEQRSYVVKEIFDNYRLMERAHYFKKYPIYLEGLKTGKFVKTKWLDIMLELKALIEEYNIKEVSAYNLSFDLNAINKTNQLIRGRENKLFDGLKQNDLWGLAVETICQQKGFSRFCKKHGLITESGKFYKSSAEAVYAYMNNIPEFEEEHTGLADVLIEVDIYNRVARQKKKTTKGIFASPYRKVAIKE